MNGEKVISGSLTPTSKSYTGGTVVGIGKFEGVHRGHRVIVERLLAVARQHSATSVALTFTNNPLSLLAPEKCPKPVMSPAQRRETLIAAGIDDVLMIDFDEKLAALSPEDFVQLYLHDALNARHVIVGDDFRFGARAAGTSEVLRELGKLHGFTVEVIVEVADNELGRVSSSRVREALSHGEVRDAARLLGNHHVVRGTVVQGDARGRELGFPTANLGPSLGDTEVEGFVPADGVYAGLAVVAGQEHQTAISVGNNPTFTIDAQPRIEAYLLDFTGDLYGKTIELHFVEFIRGMEQFDSVDALIKHMHADVAKTREILNSL